MCYNAVMKKLALFLSLVLGCQVYAFDVVYPKKTTAIVNAKSTFFIGSSDKPLKINGQDVSIHSSGGFAHVVNLQDGENKFVITSENEIQTFTITKPIIKPNGFTPPQFKKYDCLKSGYVINDKSPLRTTPVDAGINRIANLQRNILLNIDGEKGGFYRVLLENEKYAWIAKTNVKLCENYTNSPAKMNGFDFEETKNYYEFVFHFDKTVPYEISEGEKLTVKFFNIDNETGTYTKEFPFQQKLIGYSGKYSGNDFIWKIRKSPIINPKKPLKHLIIAIDAGHGGNEFGAIGCLGDKEKDINLKIAKYLEEILKKHGAEVVMTRTDDIYLGLKERVDIANYSDASIFISIHGNALPDGADPNMRKGVGVYYYYDESKELAQTIQDTIVNELGLNDDKIHQASFAVVRNTNALSILLETAYLINPDDNSKLVNEEFQKLYAKAIADGLETYMLNR